MLNDRIVKTGIFKNRTGFLTHNNLEHENGPFGVGGHFSILPGITFMFLTDAYL